MKNMVSERGRAFLWKRFRTENLVLEIALGVVRTPFP
jgi:hypothetical protein